jgi:hypothetical protein
MNTSDKTIIQIGLSREEWGPRFWEILHTLAEQSGNQKTQIESNDEADAWIILIKSQAFVMPCALCKQHYLEWQKKNPFQNLRNIIGKERQEFLRLWFWECHDRVNKLNQKESPPITDIPLFYPKKSLSKYVKEIYLMFQLALNKQQLKEEDIARYKQVLTRLRSLYGV